MPEVELSAGSIEYEDTGGEGPVIVLLHGLTMDGSLWRKVVPDLRTDHRCVVPTLPLGGHRLPMKPDADLSLPAMARLVAEFLKRVNLSDVTLVGNDWGGAQLLVSEGRAERVGRLVLVACEAFDNYPPGAAARMLGRSAKVPGGLTVMLQPLRFRSLRTLPGAWGWMSKRPVPTDVMDAWFRPVLTRPEIRRDLRKYAGSVPPRGVLLGWAERQRAFGGPVLIVWAPEDRIMPREHGPRLARLFPRARLIEIPDSYTLIPEDRPRELARVLRDFVRGTPLDTATGGHREGVHGS